MPVPRYTFRSVEQSFHFTYLHKLLFVRFLKISSAIWINKMETTSENDLILTL